MALTRRLALAYEVDADAALELVLAARAALKRVRALKLLPGPA